MITLVWRVDIFEGDTQLDGVLVRQVRVVLTKRFPSASPPEICTVIEHWKLAHDLYLSELQRNPMEENWREFYKRYSTLIGDWTRHVNALVDESRDKFGARVVTALQASRHTRHDDLPSGDAEMLAKLTKKFATTPEPRQDTNRDTNRDSDKTRRPKITDIATDLE